MGLPAVEDWADLSLSFPYRPLVLLVLGRGFFSISNAQETYSMADKWTDKALGHLAA